MIVDRPESHFIFIYHKDIFRGHHYIKYQEKPLTVKEYLEHWGKWVILGTREELDELAQKIDPFVEQGVIPCVKYDRRPLAEYGLQDCVMCVYCDDREKDQVWNVLSALGARVREIRAWVYERETIEMWSPGGLFLEKWIAANCKSEREAEEVRKDAEMRIKKLYQSENELFFGWPQ